MLAKGFIGLVLIATILVGYFWFNQSSQNEVVVYVSHDQDYAEPILNQFETETGIKVKAVYDTEASKTIGLTNRLIAEKSAPVADVFWNNEPSRTVQLKKEGVLAQFYPDNYDEIDAHFKDGEGFWTGFAARARVLVVNNDLLARTDQPTTIAELTDAMYLDQITIADPRFGTTGPHLAALNISWGTEKFTKFLNDLVDNQVNVAQSNGQTRDKVVNGEKMVGFTDTDDANDAISEGEPVNQILPTDGTLIIPNTAALIARAPNTENAKHLINYLVSPATEEALAKAKSAQIPLIPGVTRPDNVVDISKIKTLDVSWEAIADKLNETLTLAENTILK